MKPKQPNDRHPNKPKNTTPPTTPKNPKNPNQTQKKKTKPPTQQKTTQQNPHGKGNYVGEKKREGAVKKNQRGMTSRKGRRDQKHDAGAAVGKGKSGRVIRWGGWGFQSGMGYEISFPAPRQSSKRMMRRTPAMAKNSAKSEKAARQNPLRKAGVGGTSKKGTMSKGRTKSSFYVHESWP